MKYYFETSALNNIYKKISITDAIVTNAENGATGNEYLISPVTIWEVLLYGDDSEKEKLIFFAQHLLNNKLLPTPSEIIVDYMKIRFGLSKKGIKYTRTKLAKVWKDICANKSKTFICSTEDIEQLKKTSGFIRDISKNISLYTKPILDEKNITPSIDCDNVDLFNYLINTTLLSNNELKEKAYYNESMFKIYKISIFLMYLFLLINIDIMDANAIDNLWNDLGITNFQDMLNGLISNSYNIITDSPFLYMAYMVYTQNELLNEKSRGLLFDCMHTLYIPYVDLFLTNDKHMKLFKTILEQYSENGSNKIHYIPEGDWELHDSVVKVDIDKFIKDNWKHI